MTFTVAIVGRPNVGKSTLFNRLVGRRMAIVHDQPGVTRDRREGDANLLGLEFRVIDTAGFEDAKGEVMEARMRAQTERAVADADVALMLIDARAGVTPADKQFADILRRGTTPVIVIANKCEGKAGAPGMYESFGLGLGEPVPFSAEHGEGLGDLLHSLLPFAPPEIEEDPWPQDVEEENIDDLVARTEAENAKEDEIWRTKPIQMAIVGRPNVGKSTLVNALLGEDRMITGPEAGLTRDSITTEWEHEGRKVRLVDTAGLRRRANISQSLEKMSVADTLNSIRMAAVVVLVVDATAILDKQDLTIARMVLEEGRALLLAVNKWDIVESRDEALQRVRDRLETSLPQARGLPTVTISALAGRNLDKLMKQVLIVYETWNKRVSTGKLNRWLEEVTERHPPPAVQGGRRIRLRYMTQAKTRPPTFVIFASKPEDLPDSYTRYLVNSLRETFHLPGVPIRMFVRKGKNPYAS